VYVTGKELISELQRLPEEAQNLAVYFKCRENNLEGMLEVFDLKVVPAGYGQVILLLPA